jgi:hypothetical protein
MMVGAWAVLWLAASAVGAEGDPCVPVAPSGVVEDLKLVLAEGRFGDVPSRVAHMEASLPCLDGFAGPHDLPTVYQLAGTAALFSGEPAAASHYFERAAVLGPNTPFDASSLGPDAARSFAEVRDLVERRGMGEVDVIGPVVLDGVGLQTGSRVFRPVGAHLLQVVTEAGISTESLMLTEGGVLQVGHLDPEVLAAEQLLWKRRQRTSFGFAGALTGVAAGLYTVALRQERALFALEADEQADGVAVALQHQRRSRLAMTGAALSLSGAVVLTFSGVQATKERRP